MLTGGNENILSLEVALTTDFEKIVIVFFHWTTSVHSPLPRPSRNANLFCQLAMTAPLLLSQRRPRREITCNSCRQRLLTQSTAAAPDNATTHS